jgi:VWFA-related protein
LCLTGRAVPDALQSQRALALASKPPEMTDSDVVLLDVSVTDKKDNAVPALKQNQFHVFDDGIEQKISYFWEDSRPLTVGFVFDDSERMAKDDKNEVLTDAGTSFLKAGNPGNEYFIVRTSEIPDVVRSFTTDLTQMQKVYGATGMLFLYDAIYLGIDMLKEAANDRKILLIVTAGGDTCTATCSRGDESYRRISGAQLTEFALHQPVQVYSLMIADTIKDEVTREFVNRDSDILSELADTTGGQMQVALNFHSAIETQTAALGRGLKTQYLVGFKSATAKRDGLRRSLKVKVDTLDAASKYHVWTRTGYYTGKDKTPK